MEMKAQELHRYTAIHINAETEHQRVGRSIHIHGYAKEFSLNFTGCGTGLHVDLPLSALPALVAALTALQVDAEKRGVVDPPFDPLGLREKPASFDEVAKGYVEQEIVE